MNRFVSLSSLASITAGFAGELAAQSNVVNGLDGRLTVIDNLTYYGRRGPAHPGGEAGMAMLNTMCNPGSVNIPWFAAMQPNHPKFGFLVVRIADDKIEQINEWSFCKHAFTSVNVNGSCGSCVNPGTGSLMGLNCSDTYGPGNNASRTWLGPPEEIDPWLGTWDPVGSYFDIGDPSQAGYPAPADGVRSLSQSIFDNVDNRVTIDEVDLLTPNASYYYGLQLIHEGEAVANRDDNLAHRGFNPNWNGSSWSFPNNGQGQQYGSILDRWQGADVDSGSNGNDDGRFFVGVKATPIGAGVYHYEYAVHNVDSSRGGSSFSMPVDAGATVSNFSFGDIDNDSSNDWTGQRVGNEIVFAAPNGNPLEWNTIYNFGFDVDFAPGSGLCSIDAARPGPGSMVTDVPTKVPSGSTFATSTPVGDGCGGSNCQSSFYEFFNTASAWDLSNSSFTLTLNNGLYEVGPGTGSYQTPAGQALSLGDDDTQAVNMLFALPFPNGSTSTLHVCSNGFIAASPNGDAYDPTPGGLLSGAPCWSPLWHDLNPTGTSAVRVQATVSGTTVSYTNIPNYSGGGSSTFQVQFLPSGTVHFIYQSCSPNGNESLVGWSPGSGASDPGSWDISNNLAGGVSLCAGPIPDVSLATSARPILGNTIDLITSNIPSGAVAGVSLLSLTEWNPPIDLASMGMPNCELYLSLSGTDHVGFEWPSTGTTVSFPITFPSSPSLSGIVVMSQSAVVVPMINSREIVLSNGVRMLTGVN